MGSAAPKRGQCILYTHHSLPYIRRAFSFWQKANNSLACDLALSDIIQYFAGNNDSIKSLNARVGINSNSFEKYVLPNTKDPNCSICGGTLDD